MDEMELILSLDGGSTWPIRLSRDLPIEGRSFEVRLPRLPSAEARIALRAGQEGEPEAEAILAISGPLAIEGIEGTQGPSVPTMEPLARVAGEWRTPEAVTPDTPSTPPLDPGIGKNGSVDPSRDLKGADLGDEALLPVLPAPLQDGDFEQTRPRVPSPHLSSRTLLSTPRRE